MTYGEGEIYTCQVNDDTSFWYSPQDSYGEWKRGETVLPILLSCATYYGLQIHFFDSYGCRIGVILVSVETGYWGDTGAKGATCVKMMDAQVLNADYEELLQPQFADLVWEDVIVKKVQKEVVKHNSLIQPLLSWAKTDSDEALLCETGGFWFAMANGYGQWKNRYPNEKWLNFKIRQLGFDSNYPNKILPSYTILELSKSWYYEIFADEEGYYIWLDTEEEPVKAYLTKATEENDPRREFKAFFQAEDEQQNAYTFTCEQGKFSYSGSLGLGIWQTESGQQNIKVSLGKYPFEICISAISETAESKVLLKADFVEMTDENTAKFKIRSEYWENEIFYAEDQPILYTEFSIVKHLDSTIE